MNNQRLRDEVRYVKAFYGVSYKTMASCLSIKTNSMYNWLSGRYDFSDKRAEQLETLLKKMKE